MAAFPTHPDEIDAEWWAGVLDPAPARWSWRPIGTGQVGDSVRFDFTYDGAHGPATLAAKFPAADPTSRGTAAMFGLYRKEVEFYRRAAPLLDMRVPEVVFADVSDDGADFLLVFEDLGPARGGDQIAGCSIDDASAAIRQAAAIHAPSWHNAAILQAEWIQPAGDQGAKVAAMYPQAQAIWRERYADTLEPELMAICKGLSERASSYFVRPHDPPQCLVHGDFRLDNMLFDIKGGSEAIAILDWQTVSIGNPMLDIGYFLGCGIGDELRRAHERELLGLYCSEMSRRGVPMDVDTIWRDYALGALHGVSTAVFSAAFVERTARGDANFLSMARGACALALEHGSLGLLDEGFAHGSQ